MQQFEMFIIINKYLKVFIYFMIYATIRYIIPCFNQKKYTKQEL